MKIRYKSKENEFLWIFDHIIEFVSPDILYKKMKKCDKKYDWKYLDYQTF